MRTVYTVEESVFEELLQNGDVELTALADLVTRKSNVALLIKKPTEKEKPEKEEAPSTLRSMIRSLKV